MVTKSLGFLLAVVLLLTAAGCPNPPPAPPGPGQEGRAEQLARELLIIDTHIDLPERLKGHLEDVCVATPAGNFDYPRARAGGLKAAFLAIYVGAGVEEGRKAGEEADRLIALVDEVVSRCPEKWAIARSPEEVRNIVAGGRIALPLGMENGSPITGDLSRLEHYKERGISYLTLTHSDNNGLSDSSFASSRRWNGLSPFGREVVAACNRLGIMVDVSHLSDEAARQAIALSRAPVIASHSSCRRFTPGWERNLDDPEIKAIAAKGGVVQVNFGTMFLRDDARRQSTAAWEAFRKFTAENHLSRDSGEAARFREQYWKEHPRIFGEVADVAAHIDHVVKIAGVDHVGLGSDFEGVGDGLPEGLKDVSGYPNLIRELLKKGYSEADLRKICGENLLRVWSEVRKAATPAP